MDKQMYYFGTSLSESGHYVWSIEEQGIRYRGLSELASLPFNPEYMVKNFQNGQTHFFQVDGYSVWYIEGSCHDTRPGSKSVFWVKEEISAAELKRLITKHPVTKRILERCPFQIKWQEVQHG